MVSYVCLCIAITWFTIKNAGLCPYPKSNASESLKAEAQLSAFPEDPYYTLKFKKKKSHSASVVLLATVGILDPMDSPCTVMDTFTLENLHPVPCDVALHLSS